MSNIFTTKIIEDKNYSFTFLDMNFDSLEMKPEIDISKNEFSNIMSRDFSKNDTTKFSGPSVITKDGTLIKNKKDFNEEQFIGEYLKNIDLKYSPDFTFNIKDFKDNLNDLLKRKITMLCYYIASEGRIGVPNTIVTTNYIFDTYFKNIVFENMTIITNEYIEKNTIYIINNTDLSQPGYKYLKYIDKNNVTYSNIVECGFYPYKQIVKLLINE